jgi:hypothetical protein
LCDARSCLQVLHLCSVIAPNQDLTFCLSIIWCVINFALSSFFVNFTEIRRSQAAVRIQLLLL